MPAPTITALPAAPLRSQPTGFANAAEAFVDALEDLPGEINVWSAYLDSLGLDPADIPLREVPVFNFTADGEVRFYADIAMTLTQQATSGAGTVAYEKSTTAAPGTFGATTSPITLEAGAWLKVSASSVTDLFAVALKRTA
jgi:hypothetical protein